MNILRKILLTSDAFSLISGGLITPIYAIFVEKIGGDLLDASATYALFMFTGGIVVFGLALWEDRIKHKVGFITAGYAISAIGAFGYLFVNNPASLFIVQAILGIGTALKLPAYDALYSESRNHLTLAWGEWETMNYFALGAAAIAGGYIAQTFGFHALLMTMFLFSLLSFGISLLLIRLEKNGTV